jgi:hypothetical protein
MGKVTFSAPSLPSGISASFSSNPTSGSSGLTLTASGLTLPGSYPIIIAGSSGAQTVTTLLSLTVSPSLPAALTSPAPGSTLSGSTVSFNWSPGSGVTEDSLCVGDLYAGNCNLYNSGVLRGIYSANVTGLPVNGEKLYVRLCSLLSSGWQCSDYNYMMAGSPVLAALISPAPSSALTGSSATFQWSTGAGITSYILMLGSTGAGSHNLYTGASTAATSANVTGLPTTGGTLYARLYSQFNGSWTNYIDYTYTAYGTPVPAALLTPAGSTLSNSSVTFTWSTGTGVTGYTLSVGDLYEGSNNLYNSGILENTTSANVTNVPVGGEAVYVSFCSLIGTTWQCTDYTYNESGTPALLSPVPGSTITTSDVTFWWGAGNGIKEYSLAVGDLFKGSNNLYSNEFPSGDISAKVTNLPMNGENIYVRLCFYSSAWQCADFTYMMSGTPVLAALTTPAPDTTLSGSSATFQWSKGGGITDTILQLGTTGKGSHNLYNGASTTATSASVTGLPTTGVTIYARLYSQFNGSWANYIDYTYTAQ